MHAHIHYTSLKWSLFKHLTLEDHKQNEIYNCFCFWSRVFCGSGESPPAFSSFFPQLLLQTFCVSATTKISKGSGLFILTLLSLSIPQMQTEVCFQCIYSHIKDHYSFLKALFYLLCTVFISNTKVNANCCLGKGVFFYHSFKKMYGIYTHRNTKAAYPDSYHWSIWLSMEW